ncbi:hypothetical protein [Streptomyces parvus]|uniref:hypothetical protein n=1 Tax=Streptomyces parvus TaxID=66428 RepID=UPI0035DE6FE0
MFQAKDEVEIVACEDDPRAVGKTGFVRDEVHPGKLTQGRWTVKVDALLIADVLCHTNELRPTGKRR